MTHLILSKVFTLSNTHVNMCHATIDRYGELTYSHIIGDVGNKFRWIVPPPGVHHTRENPQTSARTGVTSIENPPKRTYSSFPTHHVPLSISALYRTPDGISARRTGLEFSGIDLGYLSPTSSFVQRPPETRGPCFTLGYLSPRKRVEVVPCVCRGCPFRGPGRLRYEGSGTSDHL